MKMEVGKKYKKGRSIFTVCFFERNGNAWGHTEYNPKFVTPDEMDQWTEYTEPKPPQYVPYTWEDREELRGRWYRRKSEKSEEMITNLDFVSRYEQYVFEIDSYTAAEFLENCEWLDSTPCGKVVE